MCISLLSKVHLSLELGPSARGTERLISELGWIPLRRFLWWWGWPCVKVNVKGLFVPAQQPGMRERTEDRPEYSPVTGHAAESSTLQPHSKFWLACTVSAQAPGLKGRLFIFITSNKTQGRNQVFGALSCATSLWNTSLRASPVQMTFSSWPRLFLSAFSLKRKHT